MNDGNHNTKMHAISQETSEALFEAAKAAEARLEARYKQVLFVNEQLDRRLVSFQTSRTQSESRWFPYKEGFSNALLTYLFAQTGLHAGHRILDPFAGSGTTLFTAQEAGITSVGVELLPSSAEAIAVRQSLLKQDAPSVAQQLRDFAAGRRWEKDGPHVLFEHINITNGAFPEETQRCIERFRYEAQEKTQIASLLRFAALCVFEKISFTRKDGQYLRWDYRSGRRVGTRPFNKGKIWGFTEAITEKLEEIASDLDSRQSTQNGAEIELIQGSCLDNLPLLEAGSFDGIITSPPYCNRYDYTRTYALELAFMGTSETSMKGLRQRMLSCTVENKEKTNQSEKHGPALFQAASEAFVSQETLHGLLDYLEACRTAKTINNAGIPRMVRNYFFEMALVIFEAARVLKPGAPFVMVNDNVRYQGAHIPVDLILSDFARRAGLEVEVIWVLPRGKGNSSQQMEIHGRSEVRKCVYVWRKAKW